jgi:hypothetical protein
MSDAAEPEPHSGESSGRGGGSIVPFLTALAIFSVAVIAIAVITATRGDGLTEEQRVGRAAVGQNDALQRQSYPDYRRYTCREVQGSEPKCWPSNVIRSRTAAPGTSTT